jgi:hypothetical protein
LIRPVFAAHFSIFREEEMKRRANDQPVELLLRPEVRAGLPFRRQLLLYLHPFALFKNASHAEPFSKESALRYNRAMRWMLLSYLRRWFFIAALFFVAIASAETLGAKAWFFVIPAAAFAVLACIALAVTACTLGAYVLLSRPAADRPAGRGGRGEGRG